jgi:hypothetical protein
MKREDEENAFSTGMPVNNDDGNIINDWLDDKALQKEFGHDAIKKDGKVLRKADEDIETFDYRKLFPKTDDEEVREQHGIATPGSRRSNREEEDDADEIPQVSSRSTRSRVVEVAEEEEEEDDEPVRPRKSDRAHGHDDEEHGVPGHHLGEPAEVGEVSGVPTIVDDADEDEERTGGDTVRDHLKD